MLMILTCTGLLSFWSSSSAWSQVATDYAFSQSSGTYTPITGGTLVLVNIDDGNSTQNIGFTFNFCGNNFTQVVINSNGNVRLGSANPTAQYTPLSTATNTNALSLFGRDGRSVGGVRIETIGTAPNRICVIEYINFQFQWSTAGTVGNGQIRLYETTNVVEMMYGGTQTANGTSNTNQVGIRGALATAADFNNRTSTNDWNASTAGGANNSTMPWINTATLPASGLTFRWEIPSCSGTPNAGTASISASSGCASVPLTLSVTGQSGGTGITYQWQSGPTSAGPWTDIAGATSPTSSITAATGITFYRMRTLCSTSGLDNFTSNTISYDANLSGLCSCGTYSTNFASNAADTEISSVTVGSMTNNLNTCTVAASGPGSIAGRYSNFTTSVTGPSQIQGSTVSYNVIQNSCSGFNYDNVIQIYVDWDQNGTFDLSEMVAQSNAGFNQAPGFSGTFTVPLSALLGTTRMRIVCAETTLTGLNYAQSALFTWGETEDYCFTVLGAAPCAGTPAPGNTVASVTSGCSGTNTTLSFSTPVIGSGLTYQWQSASSSAGPWTNISGATSTTFSTTITANTWYQCVVTCTEPGGGSGTSTPTNVTLISDACVCNAYCVPSQSGSACITNVTFNTINNTTVCATPFYSFQSPSTTLIQGTTYPITISCNDFAIVSVWIDWNGNGTFEASEWYQPYTSATTGTINITVPVSSVSNPRMRIRSRLQFNVNGSGDACTFFGSGETEDYCLEVVAAADCAGTPDAGTATVSSSTGCANTVFNLNATGLSIGTGLTLQWQSSPNGSAPWTDVPGGTTANITTSAASTTFYRLRSNCSFSGQENFSNTVSYTVTGGICECGVYSANFPSSAFDTEISSVTVGSMTNNLNTCLVAASGPGSIAGRYSNFTSSVTGPSEIQGSTVSYNVIQSSCSASQFTNIFRYM